jgi:hypothetical protein
VSNGSKVAISLERMGKEGRGEERDRLGNQARLAIDKELEWGSRRDATSVDEARRLSLKPKEELLKPFSGSIL